MDGSSLVHETIFDSKSELITGLTKSKKKNWKKLATSLTRFIFKYIDRYIMDMSIYF